ncbi:protein of unknown function (plasmid) [Caballeronia sp. S22]
MLAIIVCGGLIREKIVGGRLGFVGTVGLAPVRPSL